MKLFSVLLLAGLFLVCAGAASGDVFVWVDAEGPDTGNVGALANWYSVTEMAQPPSRLPGDTDVVVFDSLTTPADPANGSVITGGTVVVTGGSGTKWSVLSSGGAVIGGYGPTNVTCKAALLANSSDPDMWPVDVTGNLLVWEALSTLGTVSGSAMFTGGASLNGTITRNALIDSDTAEGDCSGTVGRNLFMDALDNGGFCEGDVAGHAFLSGAVITYGGQVFGSAFLSDTANLASDGSVLGSALLSTGAVSEGPVGRNALFDSATNAVSGVVSNDALFVNGSLNSGTVGTYHPRAAGGGGINGSSILGMP